MITYGRHDIDENITGINWRALWNRNGYFNTSVACTPTRFREDAIETGSRLHLVQNRSREQDFKFRNVNHFRLSRILRMEFGLVAKYFLAGYDLPVGNAADLWAGV